MVNGKNSVPSRWYYAVGATVLVAGLIAFIVFLVISINRISESLPQIQVVVPGTHEIHLAESGTYTVFYEHRSVIDNKVYSTAVSLSGLSVTLYSEDYSREIMLSAPAGSTTYETGGRSGRSIFEFEIEETGTYVLNASYPEGVGGYDIVLAVGQFKLLGLILGTLLGSLAILFGALIVGGVIIIVTYIRRRKAVKQGVVTQLQ